MKREFFDYLECSTKQERDAMAQELKEFYNTLLKLELEEFQTARRSHKNSKAQRRYCELIQQIGTLQAVFEILHIDYEMGAPFDDVIIPF